VRSSAVAVELLRRVFVVSPRSSSFLVPSSSVPVELLADVFSGVAEIEVPRSTVPGVSVVPGSSVIPGVPVVPGVSTSSSSSAHAAPPKTSPRATVAAARRRNRVWWVMAGSPIV
jgi:hypothetical protein